MSNEFLTANLSEGLDSVGFLSVTHAHAYTHMCVCAQAVSDSSQDKVIASVFFGDG